MHECVRLGKSITRNWYFTNCTPLETCEATVCGNHSDFAIFLSILLIQNNIVNILLGILHLPKADTD